MVNHRYHLFTLMAIFFALGVGLLMGSTLVVRNTLLEEQKRLILNMEKDFQTLRQENQGLKAQTDTLLQKLEREGERLEDLLHFFLADTLTGVRIVVENPADVHLRRTDLPHLLSLSGAVVVEEGEEFHQRFVIGAGSEEGVYYLQEKQLHLPYLLEVMMELMAEIERNTFDSLNPRL